MFNPRERAIQYAQAKRAELAHVTVTDIMLPTLAPAVKKAGKSEAGSAVMDVVPILGGVKMLMETADGQTTTGKKLEGKARLVHGLVGAGSLALDFSGMGEVEKGARVVGKTLPLFEKGAAALSARGAVKSASFLQKSSAFLAKNPELLRAGERIAENHLDDGIRFVRQTSRADLRKQISKQLPQNYARIALEKLVSLPAADLSWRPAGAPQAGAAGALGSRPFSEGRIPTTAPALPPTIPPPEELEQPEEEKFDEFQAAQQLEESRAPSRLKSEAADRANLEAAKSAAKAAKKMAPKVLNWLGLGSDTISATSDSASMGTSTFGTVFIYVGTFTWWNLSMIYGYYLSGYFQTGKENPLIPPFTWEMFSPSEDKMPIPLPNIILHGILVFFDILLATGFGVLFVIGFLVLYMLASLVLDTYGTIQSIFTGSGEFGFLGNELRSWLGL